MLTIEEFGQVILGKIIDRDTNQSVYANTLQNEDYPGILDQFGIPMI